MRDDLQAGVEPVLHEGSERLSSVGLVGPDDRQVREAPGERCQKQPGSLSVVPVGGEHGDGEQEAFGVDEDVALASVYALSAVVSPAPPFSVVFTDWLSMMAALGSLRLPVWSRSRPRSTSLARSQTPVSRHWRNRS